MLTETIQFLITHSAAPVVTFGVFVVLGFLLGMATWRKQACELSILLAEQSELKGKIAQASLADPPQTDQARNTFTGSSEG